MADEEQFEGVVINGTRYSFKDLTFREQREIRRVFREELAGSPDASLDNPENAMDFMPAMVYVLMRRDNPDFTLDEALDMKLSDLEVDAGDPPADPATNAGSGRRG